MLSKPEAKIDTTRSTARLSNSELLYLYTKRCRISSTDLAKEMGVTVSHINNLRYGFGTEGAVRNALRCTVALLERRRMDCIEAIYDIKEKLR